MFFDKERLQTILKLYPCKLCKHKQFVLYRCIESDVCILEHYHTTTNKETIRIIKRTYNELLEAWNSIYGEINAK